MSERRRIAVEGAVQGVGFRPFIYRLAQEMGLAGWVVNSAQGALIEVEASAPLLDSFLSRVQHELPPHAAVRKLEWQAAPPLGETSFEIRSSQHSGAKTALILPDFATCPECLREIRDPADRHYHYPFTNCTHCGPRFSIIHALPYDRANTTMRDFVMCEQCRAEYENPLDRRFHAQPTACPHCGPQLYLCGRSGKTLSVRWEALLETADALRKGQIIALKGLGGYQLLADARNPEAVALLRQRKRRSDKPFAVMFPALADVERACALTPAERELLESAAAPIVLVTNRGGMVTPLVAPENPTLGVMLPYTPLHHLLLGELRFPVVATSGNVSGAPIVTDDAEALATLGGIADLFLAHNRPIARPVDDSVAMVFEERPIVLRRARGYAPTPLEWDAGTPDMIAFGAHQKNTIAAAHHGSVFVSQHLGDMEHAAVQQVFKRTEADFTALYNLQPELVACDLHPDYPATRHAEASRLPVVHVQHHYAHVLSCMAEHKLEAPALGVAWDGTGYGTDGTTWGGEFLLVDAEGFIRFAALRPFHLAGGDLAAREPRRSALGVLYEMYGNTLPREKLDFKERELNLLLTAIDRGINAPVTTSMGRLFDAVAALAGLKQRCSFEGQAAMLLEFAARGQITDECYPFEITPVTVCDGGCGRMIEWKPMIAAILEDEDPAMIAAKFHNTLAALIVEAAEQAGLAAGERVVALSGGCFQNRELLGRAVRRLREAGFRAYWQQTTPPNDGGIAVGQIAAAARTWKHVSGSTGKADQHQR